MDQQIKNNVMEYTTGGHETMNQYLQDNNYYHTTVAGTDKKYYTQKETKSQIKIDEYSGRITLIDKFGHTISSKRIYNKEELDNHTYNT